jgi:hypothetical protein
MAIGASWAEIWAPVWKAVWTQEAPEPEPEPEPSQKAAGRPKKQRRKLLVEIDGQDFEVSSEEEAAVLLARAKALAIQSIEKAHAAPVRVNRGVQRPKISTPDLELIPVVQQARQTITSLYDDFSRDLEIAALMRKRDEEEEEAIIRLLM